MRQTNTMLVARWHSRPIVSRCSFASALGLEKNTAPSRIIHHRDGTIPSFARYSSSTSTTSVAAASCGSTAISQGSGCHRKLIVRASDAASSSSSFPDNAAAESLSATGSSSLATSAAPTTEATAVSTKHVHIESGEDPLSIDGGDEEELELWPGVYQRFWTWRGYRIRYLASGTSGFPVLCVHGFGGNADHWRKNLPVLGRTHRAFAIDLLGYGFSDKPDPREHPDGPNAIYNFENWAQQLRDFITEVIGEPTCITCNSVGGIAGLQAAMDDPSVVVAVQVMNISLRMLHVTKQVAWMRPFIAKLQSTLRGTRLGPMFFAAIATRDGVRNVLKQCYADASAVTEELVDVILKPGLDPGAVHVFLDFISYSGGPLPEDLVRNCPVPVSVVWGDADPWEKIEWGREFLSSKYPAVEEFVSLPNVGHCPQDERPDLVNPLIARFVDRHASSHDG